MKSEYFNDDEWGEEDEPVVSQSKSMKSPKSFRDHDEWDDEDGFQKTKRKGRMRDIEERQERKRLNNDISWYDY